MTSNQDNIYRLFVDFKDSYISLTDTDSISLTPHYVTYAHPQYADKSLSDIDKEQLFKNCLGAGKYCLAINNDETNSSSVAILNENIIQKCVYLKNKETPDKYFDYMVNFYNSCFKKSTYTKECSELAMKSAKIELKPVLECFESSFLYPSNIYYH